MSKYISYEGDVLKDQTVLLAALAALGWTRDKVEVNTQPVPLYGYQGDRRRETAEIVIRRQHVGGASNDIGFRRTEQGFVPIISEFDRTLRVGVGSGQQTIVAMKKAYNMEVAQRFAKTRHTKLTQVREGGKIVMKVRV